MLVSHRFLYLLYALIFSSTLYSADTSSISSTDSTPEAEATTSRSEEVTALLSKIASGVSTQPYRAALDEMLRLSHTSITPFTPVEQAFWAHYADVKLKQSPLDSEDGVTRPRHLNLLRLLQDPEASEVSIFVLPPEDIVSMFETSSMMFHEVCRSLLRPPTSEASNSASDAEDFDDELAEAQSAKPCESDQVLEWFNKTLMSKDACTPVGRLILMGRLIRLSAFLTEIATYGDVSQQEHIKNMIRNHLIPNSSTCPDRAISGLDDIEFDIELFHSPSLGVAIHTLLRLYKRQVIRESLVAHEFAESVEEYLYLLLLLNKPFNLGINIGDIHSAECGARKPFDTAARLLIDHLSLEGFCHYVSSLPSFHRFLMLQPEYSDEMLAMVTEADGAHDRLYAFTRSIVKPRIYQLFVLSGNKYEEMSDETIKQLRRIVTFFPDSES